ncbi:alpha-amylase [Epilithonimonas zeae]|uniref:Alpha-amylase n=1 Tax=Epilithonimonas zeae TaxID=1416779 RepID=A0A1N6FUH8_9FLAO|nr:alpha-amylase [Epilithonimonas zeae]SIN98934.1 alpha-amylase [Epilithonimonas zeae]
MNGVIIQFFHWYHPGNLWNEFTAKAEELKNLGFTAVWFPPAVKCAGGTDGRGYDVYDLYDLGEFDQRGSSATRYGTKKEYLKAVKKAHDSGLQVYADIVLNHRLGADECEAITVQQVNVENRNEKISEPFEGEAYTKLTFPGRNGKYSEFIWDHQCFSGIDLIKKDNEDKKGIFKIHNGYGTEWNNAVSHEFGNYDYLMGADVEFRNPYVVQELKNWIKWYIETTKIDGLRLDALKHISSDFLKDYIAYIRSDIDRGFFFVGEFWKDKVESLSEFSEKINHSLSLFDVPLHYNFFRASKEKKAYDLTQIFENTLFQQDPVRTVSFVGNHDTQRLQSLESTVEDWFRPIAYAIILLSENSYPCVFYPDLYGAEYCDKDENGKEVVITMPKVGILTELMEARKKFAVGEQVNYFDHPNCIAWVRKGKYDNGGCVVIISNNDEGYKDIEFGKENAGKKYIDFLQVRSDMITLDENGAGRFWVDPLSVSVWVRN